MEHVTTKRQAIAEVRALADAIIDQHTRWANGWDKNPMKRDDEARFTGVTPRMRNEMHSREAFKIAALHL